MALGTPAAEVAIDGALVRRLLAAQHPDLAELPLERVDDGWDNAMFRLGQDLAVRLPRREVGARLIINEQTWLPALAPRLEIPVPAPVRLGSPHGDYPWHWSVVPWLRGQAADVAPPRDDQAMALAEFLKGLHLPAPNEAPRNDVRGVALATRAASVQERMQRLRATTSSISCTVESVWARALAAPIAPIVPGACWLHGDLHARNVLVEGGAISGIIDWGDVTSGDVATDLAAFWMLFDDAATRMRALRHYGLDEGPILDRARGWAVLFGVVLLDTGLVDHPRHAAMGEATLRRITDE